ncbi:hypothetical protein K2X92_03215, partial [Candidatus Gracilibacteria bacterium]|nr:hypothetical protein [Candidatus Gracilibacteria bacterium]
IIKMIIFLVYIYTRDWLTLGILCIMLVSVFSSLYILRNDTSKNRVIYDILHSIAVLCIGIGVAQIIPSTGTGWSLLGISIFLLIIIPVYFAFGKTIQKVFGSILFGFLCTFYIGEFDYLIKNTGLAIFVQFFAISVILGIGYVSYIHKQKYGYINLTISLIGMLIVSSMYVDHFLGTFAVSIYLTIVASILIIRGIILSLTDFRTIGLYIGTFALLKILGYDIWQGEYGTIIRVLALMIAGGLMIYLSQLYAKYVSRTWREEFSLGYFIDGLSSSDSKKEDTESDFIQDTGTPFSIELEEELKDVVISDISSVRFVLHNGTSFTIKRASILRIAKHITTTLHKTEFAPNELSGAYDYIVHNLSSKLSEDELAALLLNFRTWIQEGGKVEFNSKK